MQSYKLSFTALGLALPDSIKVAEVFLACDDWARTRQILTDNNLLQSRTLSRNKRVIHELILRLSLLTQEQLLLLVEGSLRNKNNCSGLLSVKLTTLFEILLLRFCIKSSLL